MIKVSHIVPVLNSHEIVRRQILHWDRIGIPDAVEVILVDDGSDPPIEIPERPWLRLHRTNDFRAWTWALARNAGAKIARGEYYFMVDLDYVVLRNAFDACVAFAGDKLRFKREFGILDENGVFTQDYETLFRYGGNGFRERVANKRGLSMPPHPNNFCMHKDVYWTIGGYPEDRIGRQYPQGEDRWFKREWVKLCNAGRVKESDEDDRPTIYMFPNGQFCGDVDYNPFGLFHDLSRKNDFNPAHSKILQGQKQ